MTGDSVVANDREEMRALRNDSLASRYEQLHGMSRDELRAEAGEER